MAFEDVSCCFRLVTARALICDGGIVFVKACHGG